MTKRKLHHTPAAVKVTHGEIQDQVKEMANAQVSATWIKRMVQQMAWERAKGELNAVITVCRNDPVTDHCLQIESRILDAITVINAIVEGEVD